MTGQPWQAPQFGLFVTARQALLALDWEVSSALARDMHARSWQGSTDTLNTDYSLVSLFIPQNLLRSIRAEFGSFGTISDPG